MKRKLVSFADVSQPGDPLTFEFTWEISGFGGNDANGVRTFTGRGLFESAAEAEAYARDRGWS